MITRKVWHDFFISSEEFVQRTMLEIADFIAYVRRPFRGVGGISSFFIAK